MWFFIWYELKDFLTWSININDPAFLILLRTSKLFYRHHEIPSSVTRFFVGNVNWTCDITQCIIMLWYLCSFVTKIAQTWGQDKGICFSEFSFWCVFYLCRYRIMSNTLQWRYDVSNHRPFHYLFHSLLLRTRHKTPYDWTRLRKFL